MQHLYRLAALSSGRSSACSVASPLALFCVCRPPLRFSLGLSASVLCTVCHSSSSGHPAMTHDPSPDLGASSPRCPAPHSPSSAGAQSPDSPAAAQPGHLPGSPAFAFFPEGRARPERVALGCPGRAGPRARISPTPSRPFSRRPLSPLCLDCAPWRLHPCPGRCQALGGAPSRTAPPRPGVCRLAAPLPPLGPVTLGLTAQLRPAPFSLLSLFSLGSL